MGDLARALDGLIDQLEKKGQEAQAIARGDLTIEVKASSSRDQLGNAFRAIGWGWGGYWGGDRDYQHFSVNGR